MERLRLCLPRYNGQPKIVKKLLEGGANPNQANKYGETALTDASKYGHVDIVKMLLEGGANPNQVKKRRRNCAYGCFAIWAY